MFASTILQILLSVAVPAHAAELSFEFESSFGERFWRHARVPQPARRTVRPVRTTGDVPEDRPKAETEAEGSVLTAQPIE